MCMVCAEEGAGAVMFLLSCFPFLRARYQAWKVRRRVGK